MREVWVNLESESLLWEKFEWTLRVRAYYERSLSEPWEWELTMREVWMNLESESLLWEKFEWTLRVRADYERSLSEPWEWELTMREVWVNLESESLLWEKVVRFWEWGLAWKNALFGPPVMWYHEIGMRKLFKNNSKKQFLFLFIFPVEPKLVLCLCCAFTEGNLHLCRQLCLTSGKLRHKCFSHNRKPTHTDTNREVIYVLIWIPSENTQMSKI